MTTENSKSPVQNVEDVTNESSDETESLSEEMKDIFVEENRVLAQMLDHFSTNPSTTNDTINKDTSNFVVNILNNKDITIEYIDKIIEMLNRCKDLLMLQPQNSSAKVTDNSNISTTEKVISMERDVFSHQVTTITQTSQYMPPEDERK